MMNNPQRSLKSEIRFAIEHGFEVFELTLEPPNAHPGSLDLAQLRRRLRSSGLEVLGHTAYYLPFASPFEEVREAALEVLFRCLETFAHLEVRRVTVHPDPSVKGIFSEEEILNLNIEGFARLVERGRELGIQILLENLTHHLGTPANLQRILEAVPGLGWTLDIAHANLGVAQNRTPELLRVLGHRLQHVHISDNNGGTSDLHLPIGAGKIPWHIQFRRLHEARYNGTLTLEVFSQEREYLLLSRRKVQELLEKLRIPIEEGWTDSEE